MLPGGKIVEQDLLSDEAGSQEEEEERKPTSDISDASEKLNRKMEQSMSFIRADYP